MSFVASAPEPQVLLVAADDGLAEAVTVLAESVGAALLRLRSFDARTPATRRLLATVALVVLDDENLTRWGGERDDAVVVRLDGGAFHAGGLEQVRLPSGRDRLVDLLADAARPPCGRVVAVLGASGGLGTTTLAVAIAATADALLVDADPTSAGWDGPLGGEAVPGLRWDDLSGLESPLPGAELVARLPSRAGVRWLSCRMGDLDPPAPPVRRTVLRAARACRAATVVDLGRGYDPLQVAEVDAVLVLAATDVAGMVAATRALQRCGGLGLSAGVVLCRRSGAGLTSQECRDVLPDVVCEVPQVRGLAAQTDRGRLPEAVRRLRVPAQRCAAWAEGVAPSRGPLVRR